MPSDNTPPPMSPSDMGRMLQSMRKKRGAGTGRPPKQTACRKCKTVCSSARAAWMHCAQKKGRATENEIRLASASETFLLCQVTSDERGPVHGLDSRGAGYSRCDSATCDHARAPEGAAVWHGDENAEELWVAQ